MINSKRYFGSKLTLFRVRYLVNLYLEFQTENVDGFSFKSSRKKCDKRITKLRAHVIIKTSRKVVRN